MSSIISKRAYALVGFERGTPLSRQEIPLEELITENNKEGEYEYIYALREELDSILDLKEGEAKYVKLDRDDSESLGVILRIS